MFTPSYLRRTLSLILVLLGFGAAPAFADLAGDWEFSGMMTLDGKSVYLLTDKHADQSKWVVVGASFGDVSLVSYDGQVATVSIRRGGEMAWLPLKPSKTRTINQTSLVFPEGSTFAGSTLVASGGSIDPETFKNIGDNLRQLATAVDYYYHNISRTPPSYVDIVGPDKLIKYLRSFDGEDYSKVDLTKDAGTSVTTTKAGVRIVLEFKARNP